jgi:hypothetical protein
MAQSFLRLLDTAVSRRIDDLGIDKPPNPPLEKFSGCLARPCSSLFSRPIVCVKIPAIAGFCYALIL